MNLNKLATAPKGGPRSLPKATTQLARVLQIVDLGVQPRKPYLGKEKSPARMLWWNFELVNDKMEFEGKMVPHRISTAPLVASMDPKAALAKLVSSLDPKNEYKGDVEKFIGVPCMVQVIHNKVGENTYANIGTVVPPPDGIPVAELYDKPAMFDYDRPTEESWRALPKFIQTKIISAINYPGSAVEKLVSSLPDQPVSQEQADQDAADAPY